MQPSPKVGALGAIFVHFHFFYNALLMLFHHIKIWGDIISYKRYSWCHFYLKSMYVGGLRAGVPCLKKKYDDVADIVNKCSDSYR